MELDLAFIWAALIAFAVWFFMERGAPAANDALLLRRVEVVGGAADQLVRAPRPEQPRDGRADEQHQCHQRRRRDHRPGQPVDHRLSSLISFSISAISS